MSSSELEAVLAEVRELRRSLERGLSDPVAVTYAEAARRLSVSVSEVKAMVKASVLLSVVYAPGKRPKIPISEINRIATPKPVPLAKPRGKPSRRRHASEPMTPEELKARIADL